MTASEDKMSSDNQDSRGATCPLCRLAESLDAWGNRHKEFCDHVLSAQMELLRAARYVIDQGISRLENWQKATAQEKKATKIEVE